MMRGPATLPTGYLTPFPHLPHPRSGMELFEEALQKWEQALSVGQRGDSGSTPTPGDGLRNPETASEALSEVGGPSLGLFHPPTSETAGSVAGGAAALGRRLAAPSSASWLTGQKELAVFIGEWVTQLCLIFSSYIF